MPSQRPVLLRTILMSAFATVLRPAPMMLGLSKGSETMRPLAIIIVFGLTISTLVILALAPVLHIAFEYSVNRVKRLVGTAAQPKVKRVILTE